MSYEVATLKVVTGVVIAYPGYVYAVRASHLSPWLLFSTVFLVGLALAVHGLFTGIETSVATGTDRPTDESQTAE